MWAFFNAHIQPARLLLLFFKRADVRLQALITTLVACIPLGPRVASNSTA